LQLHHKHIVRCFELGQHGQTHFLVMELVEGATLKDYIAKQGQLSVQETARIGHETALALEHAWQQQIVHRDIKPSNILLTRDHHVKLADLGLAKFFGAGGDDAERMTTRTGMLLGTIDYLAPEQAEDAKRADIRSDIYSLGCTLYHCLTGEPPFAAGTELQKILAHREETPTPIPQRNPRVDNLFADIIELNMLAKRPEDRYQTPTELAAALEPWIGGASQAFSVLDMLEQAVQQDEGSGVNLGLPMKQATIPNRVPGWETQCAKAWNHARRSSSRLDMFFSGVQHAAQTVGLVSLRSLLIAGILIGIVALVPAGIWYLQRAALSRVGPPVPGENNLAPALKPDATSEQANFEMSPQEELFTGLQTAMYLGNNFDQLLQTLVAAEVDFQWPNSQLFAGQSANYPGGPFSLRFAGWIKPPQAGRFKLDVESDDGVRLWLDDQLQIDDWTAHARRRADAPWMDLADRPYSLKIEYWEAYVGSGYLTLNWEQENGFSRHLVPATALFHKHSDVETASGPASSDSSQAGRPEAPFWLAPRVDLDPRTLLPASIELVAGPRQNVWYQQTNNELLDPSAAPGRGGNIGPFISSADQGYGIVPRGLQVGARPYGDRTYVLSTVDPVLSGLTLLRTRMAHKAVNDDRFTIVVSAKEPCLVFVALDQRSLSTYQQAGSPAWLQGFAPTGHRLVTNDPISAQANSGYLVFVKKTAAGQIYFGPACMDPRVNSMYFAFFATDR
jgi:hypothetical protein